jgi:succinate dehydrogenase hydrophobic anchor subunit
MVENPTSDSKSGIVKKLLLAMCVTALIMASFLVGLVVFLPQLVSTARFKGFLESWASSALKRYSDGCFNKTVLSPICQP